MSNKKRRTYSPDLKLSIIMEGIEGKKSVIEICREYGITDKLYYQWKEVFLERVGEIFVDRRKSVPKDHEEKVAELEGVIGRLAIENDILKKAKSWMDTPEKKNG